MERLMGPLASSIQSAWRTVEECARGGAVFYVDSGAAELIAWDFPGGVAGLLNAGTVSVCQLEDDDYGPTGPLVPLCGGKVVVMSTKFLFEHEANMRKLLTQGGFIDCHVLCSLNEQAHSVAAGHDQPGKTFVHYKKQYEEWMAESQKQQEAQEKPPKEEPAEGGDGWGDDWGDGDWGAGIPVVASVQHVGLYGCSPFAGTLFLPAFMDMFPLCPSDTTPISAYMDRTLVAGPRHSSSMGTSVGGLGGVNIHMLPPSMQARYKSLAATLALMMDTLNVQAECFVAGHSSTLLVRELRALQAKGLGAMQDGREEGGIATLMVVDRTVDLAGPVFRSDSLLDRILNCLPPGPHIDMAPVLPTETPATAGDAPPPPLQPAPPGCEAVGGGLRHPGDALASGLLADMVTTKEKAALQQIRKVLVTAITKAKMRVSLSGNPGRVTDKQLMSFMDAFRKAGLPAVEKHSGLVQLVLATAESLQLSESANWEEILAAEKELLMAAFQGSERRGLFAQLNDMLSNNRFTVMDMLQLCLFMVGVLGDRSHLDQSEEATLRKALAARALDGQPGDTAWAGAAAHLLGSGSPGDRGTKMGILDDILAECFRKIRAMASIRAGFTVTRSLVSMEDVSTTSTPYKPWLASVLETTLVRRVDVPELEHQHYDFGLRNKLYSGFSRLLASKPRPMDQTTIFVLVLGGVSAAEIRYVTDIASTVKGHNVVLLSTGFATALGTFDQILFSEQRFL